MVPWSSRYSRSTATGGTAGCSVEPCRDVVCYYPCSPETRTYRPYSSSCRLLKSVRPAPSLNGGEWCSTRPVGRRPTRLDRRSKPLKARDLYRSVGRDVVRRNRPTSTRTGPLLPGRTENRSALAVVPETEPEIRNRPDIFHSPLSGRSVWRRTS